MTERSVSETSKDFKTLSDSDKAALDGMVLRLGGSEAILDYLREESTQEAQVAPSSESEVVSDDKERVIDVSSRISKFQQEIDGEVSRLQERIEALGGPDSEENEDEIELLQREREALTREPGMVAYGGNAYSMRRVLGGEDNWPNTAALQSRAGLSMQRLVYGTCQKGPRTYIVMRQMVDYERRGYPYTVCLDPGEAVWRAYEHNGALLIYNIVKHAPNSEYIMDLFQKPESFHSSEQITRFLFSKQAMGQQIIPPKREFSEAFKTALLNGNKQDQPTNQKVNPGPENQVAPSHIEWEQIYYLLQSIPENERKLLTWMRGQSGPEYYGAKVGLDEAW